MNIKKLKHCCMLIDVGKTRIMTDPGIYSLEEHDKVKHADIVLITHEHPDHFHIESLKALIKRAPEVSVIANDSVGVILAKEGIEHRIMINGDKVSLKGVEIEAIGEKHAMIYKTLPIVSNVGFLIENRFFYPGDALTDPKRSIEALALPVSAPWLRLSDAIDYALQVKPRISFPVHDAIRFAIQHTYTKKVLAENGIEFVALEEGGELKIG